ncbi:SEC-C domain-containing protein [Ruania alkalisoli]|uniref:SEC-C domain-containing protein n=1 Tax=Ruania alkalisoli TaxID=2779775 RepID=A0A7M1SUX8_9MICO|nr:SEC-C domain-containing protein [Ruania alkalisoli]QOR71358.1 SEC-C domain-containing protein [Ruania alkalisoli]
MERIDLLAPYGRNERCWCGSERKYKTCHGNQRPPSQPGAPLPLDRDGSRFVSPSTSVADDALVDMMPGGTPITIPSGGPEPSSISYTNWEADLAGALGNGANALSVEELGGLRVEVLRRLAGMPSGDDTPPDDITEAVLQLAAATICTVAQLAQQTPRQTMLWNQELDVAQFLGRTLLLADHVLYPDHVFRTVRSNPTMRRLKEVAASELMNAELLASGIAIPVPPGVAMAARGPTVQELTARDLKVTALTDWVRRQLILEGPTAREALLVRAADDLAREEARFWLHARTDPDSVDRQTRHFTMTMLQPYDPEFNYEPWINQVKDSAVGAFVQRTHERVVAADVFGSEYVSASLFEARLLRRRERDVRIAEAQAALWADIPELTSLSSPDLAKLLKNEHAVDDLRRQVRASLKTARSDGDSVDAITELANQLEAASHKLQKTAMTDRGWQAVIPGGVAVATMVVGGITGGLAGAGVAAPAALTALSPYLGARLNMRREAAYLFVAARRARK